MNRTKSNLYLILLVVVVIGAIGANEVGLGFISLILLFPAVWLMQEVFGNERPPK
jgi:hypothetical protein